MASMTASPLLDARKLSREVQHPRRFGIGGLIKTLKEVAGLFDKGPAPTFLC
jgi:hypothetical protein